MDPLIILLPIGTVLGIVVAVLNIREKLWPKPPQARPLEDRLRDIAIAIRDLNIS